MEINKRGAYYYAEIMLKDNCWDYFCESIAEPNKNEIIDLFGEGAEGIRYFGAVRIPWNDQERTEFHSWKYLYCIKYIDNGITLLVSKSRTFLLAVLK